MTVQEKPTLLGQLEKQIIRISLEDQLELLELLTTKSSQSIEKSNRAVNSEVIPLEHLEAQFWKLSENEQRELLNFLFAQVRETTTKLLFYISYYDKDYHEALNYNLAASKPFNGSEYYDATEIEEDEWLKAAAKNSAFDFLKDEKDTFSLADGSPLDCD